MCDKLIKATGFIPRPVPMASLTSEEILLQRPDLLEHKAAVQKYLVMIRAQTDPIFEILTSSSRDRFVIYKLCELLGLRELRVRESELSGVVTSQVL